MPRSASRYARLQSPMGRIPQPVPTADESGQSANNQWAQQTLLNAMLELLAYGQQDPRADSNAASREQATTEDRLDANANPSPNLTWSQWWNSVGDGCNLFLWVMLILAGCWVLARVWTHDEVLGKELQICMSNVTARDVNLAENKKAMEDLRQQVDEKRNSYNSLVDDTNAEINKCQAEIDRSASTKEELENNIKSQTARWKKSIQHRDDIHALNVECANKVNIAIAKCREHGVEKGRKWTMYTSSQKNAHCNKLLDEALNEMISLPSLELINPFRDERLLELTEEPTVNSPVNPARTLPTRKFKHMDNVDQKNEATETKSNGIFSDILATGGVGVVGILAVMQNPGMRRTVLQKLRTVRNKVSWTGRTVKGIKTAVGAKSGTQHTGHRTQADIFLATRQNENK